MMAEEIDLVEARVKDLKVSGKSWESRDRHSKVANAHLIDSKASKMEQKNLSIPIADRVNAMKTDGEKWKSRRRHSQENHVVELNDNAGGADDGNDPAAMAGFRRTAGGHMIRATRRHTSNRTSDYCDGADAAEEDANIEAMLQAKKNFQKDSKSGVVYADVEFMENRPAAKSVENRDDTVIYTRIE